MVVVTIPARHVPGRWKRNFLLLISAVRSQHLVIHFSLPEVIFFSVFLTLIPFHRCRITTLDFFAGEVRPWLLPPVRWSLKRVSRFLVYFRDSTVFEDVLGIPKWKFHYVPFKINGYELIRAAQSHDNGYVFSAGRSRRDFACLFSAVKDLGYPVKLLTGEESELTPHGSSLQHLAVPENVEILRGDSNMAYFVELLAGARLVVIPLVRDSKTQAGIGVYLQAMAARKCVIVSSGLGVSDVLTGGQAMIVPAGDPFALQAAIQGAWEDRDLRERYAEAAARYALPLGDEDELRRSIINSLP
jgi:glycosyltransferase involved in cell wall biosynthesis